MRGAFELHGGGLGEVGQPLDRGQSGAALEAGRERLADHPSTAALRQADRCGKALGAGGVPADQDHRRLTRAQHRSHLVEISRALCLRSNTVRQLRALTPGNVGGQDQRRDVPGGAGGGDGLGGVGGHVGDGSGAAHPSRDGAGDRVDVGLQRRVVLLVERGVVTHDDEHRHDGPACVVQVGQPVAQSWPQVQQHRGRITGQAGEPVGGAGGHTLEQGEHAAHRGHRVEGGDEVHLRGTGVGEADPHTVVDQGGDQCLGAVHAAAFGSVGNTRAALPCRYFDRVSSDRPKSSSPSSAWDGMIIG